MVNYYLREAPNFSNDYHKLPSGTNLNLATFFQKVLDNDSEMERPHRGFGFQFAFLILFVMIILLKFFFFTFIKTPLVLSTLTLGPPKLKHIIVNE